MSEEQRQRRIGGIREREGRAGMFLTLSMRRADLEQLLANTTGDWVGMVAFRNRTKQSDTHPDWEIFPERKREPNPQPPQRVKGEEPAF